MAHHPVIKLPNGEGAVEAPNEVLLVLVQQRRTTARPGAWAEETRQLGKGGGGGTHRHWALRVSAQEPTMQSPYPSRAKDMHKGKEEGISRHTGATCTT